MDDPIFLFIANWLSFWPAALLCIAGGVAALKFGADWLVDGSSNLGFRLGLSATMVGLTIVAFGTSAPELVVSVMTAVEHKPTICLGNVIGSNIANITLILGATALIFPLKVSSDAIRFDGPLCFAAIALVLLLALIGPKISRIDGLLLLVVFAVWMLWLLRKTLNKSPKEAGNIEEEVFFHKRPLPLDLVRIGAGLLLLVVGAQALVTGAVAVAQKWGVSDVVVGLTVVAGGTSLPELAVCLAAALRKHGDITVGNVLGSNIFNALLILGIASVIEPIIFEAKAFAWTGDPGSLYIDIPFCVIVSALLVPMMRHKRTLTRSKGAFLLALYLGYLATLLWRNAG